MNVNLNILINNNNNIIIIIIIKLKFIIDKNNKNTIKSKIKI